MAEHGDFGFYTERMGLVNSYKYIYIHIYIYYRDITLISPLIYEMYILDIHIRIYTWVYIHIYYKYLGERNQKVIDPVCCH